MKFILTDAGKMMESQLVAGSKPIITRIESGDTYSPNPGSLQSVINKKQLLQVESIDIVDGKSCITFLLTNLELAEEYWVKQIGIYAKQDESSAEILYLIGQDATGELVPAPEDRVVEYIYKLNLATDNAYDMSFVVNTTDFARKKQVLELERNKVSASGGDISVTVTTVEEPASAEDKYPAISGKGSTKTVLGKLLRWVKSLKMDKVTASGGDIANTNVASLQASTVQYPVPAEGDTTKVMFGKVKKFFEDIRNTATGACYIGQIVNNCVTNRADLPLSAAQGKALMDLYNVLNANTSKTGHTHDDRYYTETEMATKLKDGSGNPSQLLYGLIWLPPEYIDNPNAYFKTSAWNVKIYTTVFNVDLINSAKWSAILGVYDHNNGDPLGRQLALGTQKISQRYYSSSKWSSWMNI